MFSKTFSYKDIYYNENVNLYNASTLPPLFKSYGSATTFLRGCLALLLRVGLVLVQLGSIPVGSVYVIILQNVVDIAICLASFGLIGYIVAFGADALEGFIGYDSWIASADANLDNAVIGFSACLIGTGIITTLLCGRAHFMGYLFTSLYFSLFFQPLSMHWVWHDFGWMSRQRFLGHLVSIKDHAGGIVVHVAAGIVGTVGSLCLGRRFITLSSIDESSIGPESPGTTFSGYLLLAIGLIAFSLPSPRYDAIHFPTNYIGVVLVNNLMAMAAGIIMMIILQFLFFHEVFSYWMILRCMQGGIAGIVSVSSGVDVYSPIIAFAIAFMLAMLFHFVVMCIHNSSVEDYCNVISIHLLCGTIGSLLPPLLGRAENLGSAVSFHVQIIHLGWQLVCLTAVVVVMLIFSIVHFFILYILGFLRNKSEQENHRRAVVAAMRGPGRCFLQRVFSIHRTTSYIEPGSVKYPKRNRNVKNTSDQDTESDMRGRFQKRSPGVAAGPARIFDAQEEDVPVQEHAAKPRFIYTIPNIVDRYSKEWMKSGKFEGFGDFARNYIEGGENSGKKIDCLELHRTASNIRRCFSYHQLHRTSKSTNLISSKILSKNRSLKAMRCFNFTQSADCISHDSNYSDGFVTIKMPLVHSRVDSDFSDG